MTSENFSGEFRQGQLDSTKPILYWAYRGEVFAWARRFKMIAEGIAVWRLDRGSVQLEYPEKTEHYVAPCWILPRPQEGTQFFSEDASLLSIRFDLLWPGGRSVFSLEHSYSFGCGQFSAFEETSAALVEFLEERMPGESMMVAYRSSELQKHAQLQAFFWQWIIEYIAVLHEIAGAQIPPRRIDSRLEKAQEKIESQPLSERLVIRSLAEECGLSVSQLNRLFLSEFGHSPAKLWQMRRLEAAHQGLLDHRRSIKEIAYSLGFSSPQHFSIWFRERLHMSPQEFRSSLSQS